MKSENRDKFEGFYNKIYDTYSDKDYFKETVITINYTMDISETKRSYLIKNIDIDSENNSKQLSDFIDKCNKRLKSKYGEFHWQLFYLYKELFQFFMGKGGRYNFFRGQSGDYKLRPGILRDSTTNVYRKNFEDLYLKIAHEFPEKITYFKLDDTNSKNMESREYQLALLQHYGLRTSLLDITSNPYIAMLFMLSEKFEKYKEPTMFLFKIDETIHSNKHLFSEVRKNNLNKRIVAQKGSFLNFDKIFKNKYFDLEKISVVKIILKFDEDSCLKHISKERENLEKINGLDSLSNSDEIDSGSKEYLKKLDDFETNISTKKVECIKDIKKELLNKLREYNYFEEDLFPDFEKRIHALSERYDKEIHYVAEE